MLREQSLESQIMPFGFSPAAPWLKGADGHFFYVHIDAALGKILHTFCCGNGLKLLILWNYKPLNINTEINEKDLYQYP